MNGLSKGRIFIVEDEAILVEDLKQKFSDRGYSMAGTSQSSTEAIDLIRKVQPDLVVMDVQINGKLNGIEVAIVLQGQLSYWLPIVFLTARDIKRYDYLSLLPEYMFVSKPYLDEDLFGCVEHLLRLNRHRTISPRAAEPGSEFQPEE